jgi:hypothetical protein
MDVVQQVGHVGVAIMQVRLQHTYTLLLQFRDLLGATGGSLILWVVYHLAVIYSF